MAGTLLSFSSCCIALDGDFSRSKAKVKFFRLFSKSREINLLSFARVFRLKRCLFVVALPVFLYEILGWNFTAIGAFMAGWVIAYGCVQAGAPSIRQPTSRLRNGGVLGHAARHHSAAIAIALALGLPPAAVVLGGLGMIGIVFAINSSVHRISFSHDRSRSGRPQCRVLLHGQRMRPVDRDAALRIDLSPAALKQRWASAVILRSLRIGRTTGSSTTN